MAMTAGLASASTTTASSIEPPEVAMPSIVITGFYRYTDILYEWHQMISDPEDKAALKGFLALSSLADPGNPLRTPDDKGLELYIGTIITGQLRLMFSSAQVEYIRYWLHQMGLTKTPLPIPSSDCLLTESSLRNWSAVSYKDAVELKKALKMIEKNNKRLKGTDSKLLAVRQIFEKVRTIWTAKVGTWLAVDFEAWEMEHTVITECGWSSIQWSGGGEARDRGHYIVREHMIYTNGKYVPHRRDNYNFGHSQVVDKATLKHELHAKIGKALETGPLFLVFHDSSQDIKYLKSKTIEAPIDGLMYYFPDVTPKDGIYVVDTSDLFCALEGDVSEKRSLERTCQLIGIQPKGVHNAGNDAYYTMMALEDMASGNQLDAQREERWPGRAQTTAGMRSTVKVQFDPWDEESDFSDMEGLFGPIPPKARKEIDTDDAMSDDEPM